MNIVIQSLLSGRGGKMPRVSLPGLSNDWSSLFTIAILFVGLFIGFTPPTALALDQEDNFTLLERLGRESALELVDQLDYKPGATIYLVAQYPHPANWVMERALADILTRRGHTVVCSSTDDSKLPPTATSEETTSTTSGNENETEDNGDDSEAEDSDSESSASGDNDETDNSGANTEPNTAGRYQSEDDDTEDDTATETQSTSQTSTPTEDFFKNRLPVRGEVLAYQIVDLSISYPWAKRTWMIGTLKYGRVGSARIRADHYTEPGHIFNSESHADRIAIDEFPGWARPYLEGENYPFPIAAANPPSVRRILEPVAVGVIISSLVYLFFENQK